MNKFRRITCTFILLIASFILPVDSWGVGQNFQNATVTVAEIRTTDWGNWVAIQLTDSNGNLITNACSSPSGAPISGIALHITDPMVNAFLSIALSAKLSGKQVRGWTSDAGVDEVFCRLFQFALQP